MRSLSARLERLEALLERPVRCPECGGPGGVGVALDGELVECSVCRRANTPRASGGLVNQAGAVMVTRIWLHARRGGSSPRGSP